VRVVLPARERARSVMAFSFWSNHSSLAREE